MAEVAAAAAAVTVGMKALDNISDHYYENEAIIAWWNDWESRDQRSRIEKTFNNGRYGAVGCVPLQGTPSTNMV